ncbi:hypothetical protein SCA03_52440 [Streptomyces cacaoi]|uniref:Uncharacterized protein n=1 Tax=Streptomyces cacaoi TaxID=1898 RepID=A0A4Y3R7H0_STRCI|nr:hypothetical protein SCA03_52440 [Streptomyces cacaoi]
MTVIPAARECEAVSVRRRRLLGLLYFVAVYQPGPCRLLALCPGCAARVLQGTSPMACRVSDPLLLRVGVITQ